MPNVKLEKHPSHGRKKLPVLDDLDALGDRIRRRAYELFARRGFDGGRALDDWLEAERQICWPQAELGEKKNAYVLRVGLAGYEPDEIHVTATPTEIIVKAKHEASSRNSDRDGERVTHWSEFHSNEVVRRFALPQPVAVDRIDARYKRGILTVKAPRADGSPSKKKTRANKTSPPAKDGAGGKKKTRRKKTASRKRSTKKTPTG